MLNNIFINNDNFLVKKPISLPTQNSLEFYNPFKSYNSNEKSLIKQYLEKNAQ